jgi:hypothetical protein
VCWWRICCWKEGEGASAGEETDGIGLSSEAAADTACAAGGGAGEFVALCTGEDRLMGMGEAADTIGKRCEDTDTGAVVVGAGFVNGRAGVCSGK